jgi:AcrR family transcriptional regulator
MPRRPATDPRKRPRQARSGATVEAVLTATAEAIAEHGLDAASVNRIAARAGVSVGSLYQYYPSKEALVVALIERHTVASLARLDGALASVVDMPLEAAVRTVVAAMADVHRSPLDRALALQLDRLGPLERIQRDIDEKAGAAVARFLCERGMPERAAGLRAYVLVRAVDLVAHALLVDRDDVPFEVAVDELTALVLGYLARPE